MGGQGLLHNGGGLRGPGLGKFDIVSIRYRIFRRKFEYDEKIRFVSIESKFDWNSQCARGTPLEEAKTKLNRKNNAAMK